MDKSSGYGFLIYLGISLALAAYFAFAAVQGELGVLKRLQAYAELRDLEAQRIALQAQVDKLENKTRRLSDGYLDLDLLDERARNVLGMVRSDDLVLR
ncbi:MAG: septum formation initiator family protein [Rhodobacteraceae bacterium]|nr:septum formation initiator family protein [Paracoccaceae bacterium]